MVKILLGSMLLGAQIIGHIGIILMKQATSQTVFGILIYQEKQSIINILR